MSLYSSLCLRLLDQRGKILIVPVRRWLLAIDVVEEAAGYFLLFQVLQDTEIASLVVISRMTWTSIIRAGTEFLCVYHFATSSQLVFILSVNVSFSDV